MATATTTGTAGKFCPFPQGKLQALQWGFSRPHLSWFSGVDENLHVMPNKGVEFREAGLC